MTFLKEIVSTAATKAVVVGFDVSGSTIANSYENGIVLEEMAARLFASLRSDGVSNFRVGFFGSKNTKMPNGYVLEATPFPVTVAGGPDPLETFVKAAKLQADRTNLTCPHFLIDALPDSWMRLASGKQVEFRFVTDGELFDGDRYNRTRVRQAFSTSIGNFFTRFPHASLSIIAVDVSTTDVGEGAAGCDVYKAIQERGLTDQVRAFHVVGKANEGKPARELISNLKPSPGHVAYKDKMFKLEDEGSFYRYVQDLVLGTHDMNIYTHVRQVGTTIANYVKLCGMSPKMMEATCRSYRRLFGMFSPSDAAKDDVTVDDVLDCFDRQLKNILGGHAEHAAAYSTDRKRRIEFANEQLAKSVRNAVAATGTHAVTLPVNGVVYQVSLSECTGTYYAGRPLPNCAYTDSAGKVEPCVPFTRKVTEVSDQAMRQYVRAIAAQMHGKTPMQEVSKFVFLCHVLGVYLSDVPKEVKDCYANAGATLLRKTSPGSSRTELETCRAGGVVGTEWVSDIVNAIRSVWGLAISARLVWYGICKAVGSVLGDDLLALNQHANCKEDVPVTSDWLELLASIPRVTLTVVAPKSDWSFECPITLESTAAGGFALVPHSCEGALAPLSDSASVCSPRFVMSKEAVDEMGDNLICMYCRSRLPKEALQEVKLQESTPFFFPERERPIQARGLLPVPGADVEAPGAVAVGGCAVIALRGVIGSGKSSATALLMKQLLPLGKVYVAGTDAKCVKFISQGGDARKAIGSAIRMVKSEVQKFIKQPGRKFIIIDTCGDVGTRGMVFDIPVPEFSWHVFSPNLHCSTQEEWDAYFAWSLSNVLKRTSHEQSDAVGGYWLNPQSAGVKTCIDVHAKKACALFGAHFKPFTLSTDITTAVHSLKDKADAYTALLSTHNLEADVTALLAPILA